MMSHKLNLACKPDFDEFISKTDPRGIMLWIPAEPKDQQDVLDRVKKW